MILPQPSPTTAPFWAAARAHRLELPRCDRCRRWVHPQATACPCGAGELRWERAGGRGRLVSFTVVRRAPHPALADAVPYTITLVALDEGPQLVSGLPGEGHGLVVGERVEVDFDDVDDEIALPRFVPAGADTR
jgi:uncharacterized OB-fold protein